ncbi:MAG: succinate dehydrogenase assembly factor 2 [Gammaproteobacteria bacterium]|nr:succinate dehydrogenase assembly factor 2 [Gammaproteobacteria bacterium]MCI0590017.1 succinate dehydrogenase assembly factor 2 [Gammaproteobacteria bacterium]
MGERSRLLWRCRRGLRELDLMLQRFVERRYDDLPTEDKHHFEELLNQSDDDLLSWLKGRSQPGNTGLARLVEEIRMTSTIEK